MAGALRKTMEYLGLAEVDPAHPEDRVRRTYDEPYDDEMVHDDQDVLDDELDEYEEEPEHAQVTPLPRRAVDHAPVHQLRADQDHTGGLSRIVPIHPRTYNEAKAIGESFRDGVPVIMNLTDMDDNDAKRLVDFAAGLVFGLHGTIERVTSKVFLLSPSTVEVTPAGGSTGRQGRVLFNQS